MASLKSLLAGVGLASALIGTAAEAQSAGHRLELRAKWATAECVTPATFRVTMGNAGDTTFWVPKPRGLGNGQAINLLAKQKDVISSTSMYFPTPHPQDYWTNEDNFVELQPGEEFAVDLLFDGAFTFHGPGLTEPTDFHGEIRFLYTQPEPFPGQPVGDFGPVLFYEEESAAISNVLSCLE